MTLVQRVVLEQVRARSQRDRGTLGGPRHGRTVVTCDPDCALANVMCLGQDVLVCYDASQFQVRNRDQALAMIGGDKRVLDMDREKLPPHDGRIRSRALQP